MRKIFTAFMMMLCAVCAASAANYLTFTAEEDSSTFGIVNNKNTPDVQYSLDGGETWTALAAGDTITLAHKGDKALLRGNNPEGFSKDWNQFSTLKMTGKVAASGSVMSLIDGVGISTEVPGNYCFYKLFQGCTSLTRAPELPATTLAEACYSFMFSECTSLTQVPTLPATTLASFCYDGMFAVCTSLTQAPELPAMTLTEGCYKDMFSRCTSLTQAPELPATKLARACYFGMFEKCTNLTQAPKLLVSELPATLDPKGGCYGFMFLDCTNLSEICVDFNEWDDNNSYGWVYNVAPTGTFICPKALAVEYGTHRIPEGWTVKYVDDTVAVETNYLTFTAEEDSSSFGIVNNGDNNPNVQYSIDGGETWNALTGGEMVTLAHKGDKALLRGNNLEGFSKDWRQYSSFKMTGKVAASGSVMSLIDGVGVSTEISWEKCFLYLFEKCTSLTRAPELPATTLAEACYTFMFSECTSLTQAPALPATTLADFCYCDMFEGCTGLTQAPELPATTLAEGCYSSMFSGCTSLTQAPELPATTLADGCYYGMFSDCTSLTQAPELPVTSLSFYCYAGMFSGCTNLTQAPELPATTLAEGCYATMFWNCTSLTQAPELPATTLAVDCYRNMFQGCTSLTQAPELSATTLADNCYFGMFKGCTSLTQAPELPATTLNNGCYPEMFIGCTSLSEIKVSFDDWNDGDYTLEWVVDVAPAGTFICPKDLPLEYGVCWIPEGWTVKYIDEEGSSVSSTLSDGVTVWTDDLTVFVRGAEGEVSLYDMSGRRIALSNSADEERALCVPSKGVYVVRTSGGERSVLVR